MIKVDQKGKVVPVHAMKAYVGVVQVWLHSFVTSAMVYVY